MQTGIVATTIILLMADLAIAQQDTTMWKAVETIFGRAGTIQNDMIKFTFPRSDLKVKVGDIQIEPALALTSWLAFQRVDGGSMVMGDLVLTEREIDSVTSKLIAADIKITAVHNHLLRENPRIIYMHIEGFGAPSNLAANLLKALKSSRTPLGAPKAPQPPIGDWATIEGILGTNGQHKGNVLQYSFPRADSIDENGIAIPPFMGVASSVNFQQMGGRLSSAGDLVLTGNEVNPVIKALKNDGIEVTAVHSHMLFEEPRLFFLHFWGTGDPSRIAQGLKNALNQMNLAR